MKRILILIFFAFFLCGCASSSSTSINISPVNEESAIFNAGNCTKTVNLRYLGSSGENSRVILQRYFFENNGNIAVYERGRLYHNLEFSVSVDSVVNFAFELKNAKINSLGNFHSYIEGESKKYGKKVYIISASVGMFDGFDIFYSDNEELVKNFASCIKNGSEPMMQNAQNLQTANNVILPLQTYIRSDFSPALFIKYDIIKSKNDGDRFLR